MAYIAFMECWHMTAITVGQIMTVYGHVFSDLMNSVAGNLGLVAWITLVVLRFLLALNRFAVITDFSCLVFLGTSIFHRISLASATLLLLATIAANVYIENVLFIAIPIVSHVLPAHHFVYIFETYLSNILCSAAFLLYAATGIYLITVRRTSNLQLNFGELRLMVSSALGFFYEMFMLLVFHFVFPYISIPVEFAATLMVMWAFLPGFNMLVFINK
ncbi:hypothetical protein L596_020831 [Steinernema carpocapsae]|uniref:7TM GPCR serpentine receptor class x (Srx) domain-containing protein n=1 Tax=Steinernema carpocapsae TaxID=34508 RepID=A0A4U5MUR1_STECR|nr:hypothetical protein L596_020831 [Steinernema carpocapsae]